MKPPAGFTVRAATPDDAQPVADLMNAFDSAYLEAPDTIDGPEVGDWWKGRDLDRDVRVIHDSSGALAAYGMVRTEGDEVLDGDLYVHPDAKGRGLGSYLLTWLEEEGVARDRPILHTAAVTADPYARPLIEGRGFALVRHFYRMYVDLDAPPPPAEWPPGFSVEGFEPGDEARLHAVLDEAFADHWGHEPRSLEEWQTTVFGKEWWDPSLTYLVTKGDETVAAAINAVRFGVGWIGTLGTLAPWRGKGLGRALLVTAFAELYRRGERRIGLAVDAGNETGATHLYESVGMRVAWQADVYEKHR